MKSNEKYDKTKLEKVIFGDKKSNTVGIIFFIIILIFFIWMGILSDNNSLIYLLIFIIVIIFVFSNNSKQAKKFIESLDKELVDNIEKELEKPFVHCNYHYAITDSYIIKGDKPYAILEYDDIILMYKKTRYNLGKYSTGGIDEYLILITKENKEYEFLISTTVLTLNYEPKDFSDIIKQKNANILDGKTEENIKIIKQRYNIDL